MSEVPQSDQLDNVPHPRFSDKLIGHQQAEQQLLEAWNQGRLHHAWLITGVKGVGKATLAYRFARFLLSQGEGSGGLFGPPDSLDVDPTSAAVKLIEAGSHPGLAVLKRQYDEKTKKLNSVIKVSEVRALSSFFGLRSSDGGWRVVIVDTVDDMNNNSANAILKILEEPPTRTIFLLLSHTPARLLPTIRSRCRQLALEPLNDSNLKALIHSGFPDFSDEQLTTLVGLADGSYGRAIALVNNNGLEIFETVVEILESYPAWNPDKLHGLSDLVGKKEGEQVYRMVVLLLPWWISRMIRFSATTSLPQQLFADEILLMQTLLVARPLDKWVTLWENMSELISRADAVNLDRKQIVLALFLKISEKA